MTTTSAPSDSGFRLAKIGVWWDIENCPLPRGAVAQTVTKNIGKALKSNGFHGQLSIRAHGDTGLIAREKHEAITSTGIALNHIPAGCKDDSDKAIMVDMMLWAMDNPPPAIIMLVSGDCEFSSMLHRLRHRGYTIILSWPGESRVSRTLLEASALLLDWHKMAAGAHVVAVPSPFPNAPLPRVSPGRRPQQPTQKVSRSMERLLPTAATAAAPVSLEDQFNRAADKEQQQPAPPPSDARRSAGTGAALSAAFAPTENAKKGQLPARSGGGTEQAPRQKWQAVAPLSSAAVSSDTPETETRTGKEQPAVKAGGKGGAAPKHQPAGGGGDRVAKAVTSDLATHKATAHKSVDKEQNAGSTGSGTKVAGSKEAATATAPLSKPSTGSAKAPTGGSQNNAAATATALSLQPRGALSERNANSEQPPPVAKAPVTASSVQTVVSDTSASRAQQRDGIEPSRSTGMHTESEVNAIKSSETSLSHKRKTGASTPTEDPALVHKGPRTEHVQDATAARAGDGGRSATPATEGTAAASQKKPGELDNKGTGGANTTGVGKSREIMVITSAAFPNTSRAKKYARAPADPLSANKDLVLKNLKTLLSDMRTVAPFGCALATLVESYEQRFRSKLELGDQGLIGLGEFIREHLSALVTLYGVWIDGREVLKVQPVLEFVPGVGGLGHGTTRQPGVRAHGVQLCGPGRRAVKQWVQADPAQVCRLPEWSAQVAWQQQTWAQAVAATSDMEGVQTSDGASTQQQVTHAAYMAGWNAAQSVLSLPVAQPKNHGHEFDDDYPYEVFEFGCG